MWGSWLWGSRLGGSRLGAVGEFSHLATYSAVPVRVAAMDARLVVLVSGAGTNLQALIDESADPAYGATVVAVGADRDGIAALDRAKAANIPVFTLKVGDFS